MVKTLFLRKNINGSIYLFFMFTRKLENYRPKKRGWKKTTLKNSERLKPSGTNIWDTDKILQATERMSTTKPKNWENKREKTSPTKQNNRNKMKQEKIGSLYEGGHEKGGE